jgi:hypothetical protein
MRAAILLAAAFLGGCGYTAGEPSRPGVTSVAVPIARNMTLRRGNEFGLGGHEIDLTNEIRSVVLARTPYELRAAGDADISAEVEILSFDTPFLVEDPQDRPLVTNVSIEIRLTIRDRAGKVLSTATRRESGYLVPSRDEDEAAARAEAFEKLARWVVARLEGGW